MLKKLSHAGSTLFVFMLLAGVLLWCTCMLHIGLAEDLSALNAEGDGHEGHGESDAREAGGVWCAEHNVPESACTRCDPSLAAAFKAKGDWCAGHGLPESQCVACNPGLKEVFQQRRAAAQVELADLEKQQCEHGKPTVRCDKCRFEMGVVKLEPGVAEALIKSGKVEKREKVKVLRLTGEVQSDPTRVVDVPPAAEGRVVSITGLLGQPVAKGDVLAVLHSAELGEARAKDLDAHAQLEIAQQEHDRQIRVNAALTDLLKRLEGSETDLVATGTKNGAANGSAAEAIGEKKYKLLGAASRLRLARSVYEREKELHTKDISSKADYEQARQGLQSAEAEYAAAVEEVQLNMKLDQLRTARALKKVRAALNVAEQRLRMYGLDDKAMQEFHQAKNPARFGRLEVKAPRAGTIIAQTASVGKYVQTTQSLYTIADLSHLWVWADLYERDLAVVQARLSSGKPLKAVVRVLAFGNKDFPGTVDLAASTLDEHTRTVKLRVRVENQQRMLKPGMFAKIEIRVPLGEPVSMVPREAVVSDEGTSFVFVRWKDDFWVRRNVVVGRDQGRFVEILHGVADADTVAVSGSFMLKSDVLRAKMGAGCAD